MFKRLQLSINIDFSSSAFSTYSMQVQLGMSLNILDKLLVSW